MADQSGAAMTAEIISLADRRRRAERPAPAAGSSTVLAASLAAACRALTASLDRAGRHGAAIRADLERLPREAAATLGRSLAEIAHA
jgi:hypothetical protein